MFYYDLCSYKSYGACFYCLKACLAFCHVLSCLYEHFDFKICMILQQSKPHISWYFPTRSFPFDFGVGHRNYYFLPPAKKKSHQVIHRVSCLLLFCLLVANSPTFPPPWDSLLVKLQSAAMESVVASSCITVYYIIGPCAVDALGDPGVVVAWGSWWRCCGIICKALVELARPHTAFVSVCIFG